MQDRKGAGFLCGLSKDLNRRSVVMLALAGGVLLGVQSSRATIVAYNVGHTVSAANVESYNLDLDRNGSTDFTFDAAYVPDPVLTVGFDQIEFPFGSINGAVIDKQTGDGFPPTSLLPFGAVISSARLFCLSGDKADLFYDDTLDPITGNFGGKTGYVGLQFSAPDGTHYGYAQVTVNDLNTSATPLDLTIGTVAYNTVPGQAITAGAVPEPTSAFVLGGMTAAAALRRRRR